MVAWTEEDLVILAKVMKKKVSNKECVQLCREYGLDRELDVMKKRWAKLRNDYKLVNQWEEDPKRTLSYFELSKNERKVQALPVSFSERVYETLSSGPRLKKRRLQEDSSEPGGAYMEMNEGVCKSEGEVETTLVPAAHWYECPIVFPAHAPPELPELMDGVTFADACLRFDDDNVMDGFLVQQGAEHTEGELLTSPTALPALEDAHPVTALEHELEMLERRSHEARMAVESYDKKRMQWQKNLGLNQQGMEYLMKADCDVLAAVKEFVLAAQSLIEKLA